MRCLILPHTYKTIKLSKFAHLLIGLHVKLILFRTIFLLKSGRSIDVEDFVRFVCVFVVFFDFTMIVIEYFAYFADNIFHCFSIILLLN